MSHRGFTLLEILVVVAIIGLMSAITLTAIGDTRVRTRDTRRLADLSNIAKKIAVADSTGSAGAQVCVSNGPLSSITCTPSLSLFKDPLGTIACSRVSLVPCNYTSFGYPAFWPAMVPAYEVCTVLEGGNAGLQGAPGNNPKMVYVSTGTSTPAAGCP